MKNLSAISKKGIILVSAVIMIMAGAFVALLPSTSRACGGGGMGEGTSYVHVPILNNTGETLTIGRMFIEVPDVTNVCKNFKTGKICIECTTHGYENEMRVKAIYFGGVTYYTAGSTGHSHCHRYGSPDNIEDKTITLDTVYPFSGAKVECKIALDVCPDALLTGSGTSKEYTIKYYFTIDGGPEKSNTVTFNLPVPE